MKNYIQYYRTCAVMLLAGMFTVSLHGYTHTIRNLTPYNTRVFVHYATGACSNNNFELPAGMSRSIDAGICNLSMVEATVFEVPLAGAPNQPTAPREIKARRYNSTYTGNATWLILGPHKQYGSYGSKDKDKTTRNYYTISRVCR